MEIKSEPAYTEHQVTDIDAMLVTGGLQFTIRDGDQIAHDDDRVTITLKDITYILYRRHIVWYSERQRVERIPVKTPAQRIASES